ncbi:hypothetical protein AB7W88_18975 [Providencia vermicola]|uniref:hypothetical protein n=1 Tax=Providencia TaxID=586 RepID=UPI0012B50EAC|nr:MULTISPECIES: hypothetical protein [Providencia]MTB39486.1 hypothetical protein [Providencia sp. wls1949]QIC16631.1 hypothetical protein G3341_13510 [Providencia vermicola]
MIKRVFAIAMLCAAYMPAQAMKEYQLQCPERDVMTILHTNYLITTLKWGSSFIISHPTVRYSDNNIKYKIYNFLNGDSLVKTAGDNKHYYFVYKNGHKVECNKIKETELEITKLPRVHNVG